MERVTLDAMTRFPNLHAFLSTGAAPSYSKGHLHAKGYQDVTNTGDNTTLNLWNPTEDFTLSQQWIVGGSGTGMQTVEGGWVHSTRMFGSDAVLFIYFTPDDYSTGCYNLDCTGFIQTDPTWTLGAGWSHYSSIGGTQYIFTMQWQYYQGNWWLLLKGGSGWTDVGYYPGSVYGSGPLASGNASRTTFGGEVCNGPSGGKCTDPNWPQMGSGNFASAGWQQAAYQHDLFYINSSGTSVWSSLTPVTESSKCYSTTFTPSSSGGSWGSYIHTSAAPADTSADRVRPTLTPVTTEPGTLGPQPPTLGAAGRTVDQGPPSVRPISDRAQSACPPLMLISGASPTPRKHRTPSADVLGANKAGNQGSPLSQQRPPTRHGSFVHPAAR